MNYKENLLKRADFVLEIAEDSIDLGKPNEFGKFEPDYSKTRSLKSSGLSFILSLFGEEHPYYKEFNEALKYSYESSVSSAKEIIHNIKSEIENGWLDSIKGIVSAEIFTDFLEMAEHLLQNDYKDPAAVMIGSVLEEHLRQLCLKNGIDITYEKDGKILNLKADRMNSELAKASIYNKLDQKNITALLDLRNKAAHGNYSEYDKNQVDLMYKSVFDFLSRNPL